MLLLLLFGVCLLVGAGAIVISIIGAIASLFVKSGTTEKPSGSSLNVVTQEKTASQQQQTLAKNALQNPTHSKNVTTSATPKTTVDSFVIENGVLIEYKGTDQNISIPQGVYQIGEEAF